MPLEMDAISIKQKPSALNCVDLYVNMHNPDDISTTIVINDQLCCNETKQNWNISQINEVNVFYSDKTTNLLFQSK